MTMRQNTLSETENTDLALMKNWDQQKTLPLQRGQLSSKKRSCEAKRTDPKSSRKTLGKTKAKSILEQKSITSLINRSNNPRQNIPNKIGSALQSNVGNTLSAVQNSLNSANSIMKSQIQSVLGNKNEALKAGNSNHTKNMKSQISK